MKTQQIAAILSLAAVLGACADATLSTPETRTPPLGAAFDGGVGFGSGGFTQGTTPNEPTSTANTTCTTEDGRTGVGFGSGGRFECVPIDPQ